MTSRARRHKTQKQGSSDADASPTTEEILRRVDRAFREVEEGLKTLLSVPANQRIPDASALRSIAVWGHATTQVLQKLRGIRPDFEDWYAPIREQMEADPLMKFFFKLRSQILKEGGPDDYEFVIHRQTMTLDKIDVEWSIRFTDGPTEHKGQPIAHPSITNVCGLYVEALREVVQGAHATFD